MTDFPAEKRSSRQKGALDLSAPRQLKLPRLPSLLLQVTTETLDTLAGFSQQICRCCI